MGSKKKAKGQESAQGKALSGYRWYWLSWLVLIPLSLAVVLFLRVHAVGWIPPTAEPYMHMLSAQDLRDGIPRYSMHSSIAVPYVFNLYDLMLLYAGKVLPLPDAVFIISLVSSALSAVALYLLMRKAGLDARLSALSSSLFVISPCFLSIGVIGSERAVAFLLVLVAAYLSSCKSRSLHMLSAAVSLIIPLFGMAYAIAAVLLMFSLKGALDKGSRALSMASVMLSGGLFYGYCYLSLGVVGQRIMQDQGLMHRYISDFGGLYGFATFAVFLSFLGIRYIWQHKHKMWRAYISMLIAGVVLIFSDKISVFAAAVLSILSAKALLVLWDREWHLGQIKTVSLILVICGFVFSFVLQAGLIRESPPDAKMKESLDWLSGRPEVGNVASYYSYGHWIRYYSGKQPVYTSRSAFEGNASIVDELFMTRNLRRAKEIMNASGIGYIWITEEMKDGLVWNKNDEGLLFLLSHSEDFKNSYNNSEAEVWEVI